MNKIKLNSWGQFTDIEASQYNFKDITNLKEIISKDLKFIPSGNYRSYGDSAFAENIINSKNFNSIIAFDKSKGILNAQAGITLKEILEHIIPCGWFLGVTPGTKFSTLGGVIASDVHGKNHHMNGCFSEYIKNLVIMLPDGSILDITKDHELFKASCGGMGLTGIILSATIKLIKIRSTNINQTTIKTKNLRETFEVFEQYNNERYSVAWFDGFSRGRNFGRSIVQIGDFADDGQLEFKNKVIKNIPFNFLSYFITKYQIRFFNYFYYLLTTNNQDKTKVYFDKFFYPLDKFSNWNKIYGKDGLIQYQFILPFEKSFDGILDLFKIIQKNNIYPYLAVLKLYGKKNDNYLSFPIKGYSLALDFKSDQKTLSMLNDLDKIIIKYGGRIYLTKDGRLNQSNFKQMYPNVETFINLRKKYGCEKRIQSCQSIRVGI